MRDVANNSACNKTTNSLSGLIFLCNLKNLLRLLIEDQHFMYFHLQNTPNQAIYNQQMEIGKQGLMSTIRQLMILVVILASPIAFVWNYEMRWLQAIDVDEQVLSRTLQLEIKINQTLKQLTYQKQKKAAQVFPKHNIFSEPERAEFQKSIADRIQTNGWLGALSNIRKLTIINVAIHSEYEGNRVQLQKKIMRGLQWLSQAYQINLRFLKWNTSVRLDQVRVNTVLVVFQEFRNELVQENVGSRLRRGEYANEFYIPEITKQLRSTPLFCHCKFTNQPCTQKTILIMPEYSYQGCSINIQNEFYIVDRLGKTILFELIANVLDLGQLEKVKSKMEMEDQPMLQFYQLLKNISFYRESQKILGYVRFTMNPITDRSEKLKKLFQRSYDQLYEYLLHGKYLSPYIHNLEEKQIILKLLQLVQNQVSSNFDPYGQRLEVDPLTDSRVGKIDIFANNFKVGVYLPLFVLFFYPVAIKFKDLFEGLFATVWKQNRREEKETKVQ